MNFLRIPRFNHQYFRHSSPVWHHILFWIIYFLFNTTRWGFYYDDLLFSLKGNLVEFPIHIIICYFTLYYLIPTLVPRKKYLSFFVILLGIITGMMFLKFQITYHFISNNVWPEGPEYTDSLTPNYMITMILGEVYVVSFVTAIKITMEWLRENQRATSLEKEQLETELRFLRAQISPHFFFNTLNNIYSLTIEKSEKAPEIILRLSQLMRYLLYHTKGPKHCLKKEIECIQNYLELEKIRYDDQVSIDMQVEGDLNNKKVPPMLLISFIENCFKHGASKNLEKTLIKIHFHIDEETIQFKATNTIPPDNEKAVKPLNSGIGLSNAKKRLELGYPKGSYEMKNYIENQEYIVTLKIPA